MIMMIIIKGIMIMMIIIKEVMIMVRKRVRTRVYNDNRYTMLRMWWWCTMDVAKTAHLVRRRRIRGEATVNHRSF